MNRTRINFLCNLQPSTQTFRKHGTGKAIFRIIRNGNSFFVGFDGDEREGGTERFRVPNVHVFFHVRYDEGSDSIGGGVSGRRVSIDDFGAFGNGILPQFGVFLDAGFGDE